MRGEQAGSIQLQKAGCKGEGFKLWNIDISGQLERTVCPGLGFSWFGGRGGSPTGSKRDYCFGLVIICRDMLNGFHSPIKFVCLKQIHRCCENWCRTKHRQGSKKVLWAEVVGNNYKFVLQSHTEAGSQLWKHGTGTWKWWTIICEPQ